MSKKSKLIVNDTYFLKTDIYIPKKFQKIFNNYYKFIRKNENKILFNNGNITFTLWANHRYKDQYMCYITLEKTNKFRITNFPLNAYSVFTLVKICDIQLTYLKSCRCIRTLETFIFTVDFYNKINIKKNLKKVPAITKVFQNTFVIQYISEYL